MHKLAAAHVWAEEKILDMLVEEDHSTAQMLLEDLPLYPDLETLEIESSELSDEDLMMVPHVCETVRYLNLKGNLLKSPWIFLTTKFPNVFHLDIRDNRHLTFEPVQELADLFKDLEYRNLRILQVDDTLYRNNYEQILAVCPYLRQLNGDFYRLPRAIPSPPPLVETDGDDEVFIMESDKEE
ncbi:hypothetical protein Aduo_005455 [Ancylostoma duodenale]